MLNVCISTHLERGRGDVGSVGAPENELEGMRTCLACQATLEQSVLTWQCLANLKDSGPSETDAAGLCEREAEAS